MTPLQLELTKLIGKKDLSFGCYLKSGRITQESKSEIEFIRNNLKNLGLGEDSLEIIGHPATLSDFQRWLNNNKEKFFDKWTQDGKEICVGVDYQNTYCFIYNSSKDLLDQSEETLKQIIDLIKKYS